MKGDIDHQTLAKKNDAWGKNSSRGGTGGRQEGGESLKKGTRFK